MRAMFGLVGLLAAIGVIVAFMAVHHPADTIRQGESAKQQLMPLTGQDQEGVKAKDSIHLVRYDKDGKVRYLLVDKIMAGGPMEKMFGLKRGDKIIRTGPIDFKDDGGSEDYVFQAYGDPHFRPLVVIRDNKQIELPQPESSGRDNNSLNQQIDAIPGIR